MTKNADYFDGSDILDGLNEEQAEAVKATEGYVRTIAGAGSGKTLALSRRYAYLVNVLGILPEHILCATFTNKAANEMKKRIRALSVDADTGYISTFHSFCVSVLQEDINAVQYPKNFIVLDNSDIDTMLGIVYEERNLTMRHMTFSKARDMIEIKKTFTQIDYYESMLSLSVAELREKYLAATEPEDMIFWGYVYQEKKCFALDYNDLINFVLYIFSVSADVREKWQKGLEYIMVDEYQDIDNLQFRLLNALCPVNQNLFIVGDPDQTIYTWRGANVKYILDFDKYFRGAKTVMLNTNYRSTPEILAVANSLISKNGNRVPKDLIAVKSSGVKPEYYHAKTANEEATHLAEEIKRLITEGYQPSDMAVLYRAHYLSRTIEDVFMKEDIPYTIFSGVQFFDRMEIKDALAYLRMAVYRDDLSFLRTVNTPKRNIGEKRITFLREYALDNNCSLFDALCRTLDDDLIKNTKAKSYVKLIERYAALYRSMSLSEMLTLMLDESGYESMLRLEGSQERLDNLSELKQAVREYEDNCGEECSAEDYLERVALMNNNDMPDGRNTVKLTTVHTAKGLEFPVVFLVGMDEGIFPSKKSKTLEELEEERRLAFVALTRAKDRLYVSDAEGRNLDGSYRYPSRFIFNIDKPLLDYKKELDPFLTDGAANYVKFKESIMELSADGNLLSVGDRIKHTVFGKGAIVGVDRDKNAYAVKFDALATVRNISFAVRLIKLRGDADDNTDDSND